MIDLRGKVIPILALYTRFGRGARPHGQMTRGVVIEPREVIVDFVVDEVSEVPRANSGTVEHQPAVVTSLGSEYIKGVGWFEGRFLMLLGPNFE